MPDNEVSSAFMSALVAEHSVLQSVASSTIFESGSRAALYLSALSSGLVAIGFASSNPQALALLALSILPTVFLLGCFTVVRLIDTSVENIVSLQRIALIRTYYATLHHQAPIFFGDTANGSALGVRYRSWSIFFTMASMIMLVNSVLGGAAVALVCALAFGCPIAIATSVGVAAGLLLVVLNLWYQRRRLAPLIAKSAPDTEGGFELT